MGLTGSPTRKRGEIGDCFSLAYASGYLSKCAPACQSRATNRTGAGIFPADVVYSALRDAIKRLVRTDEQFAIADCRSRIERTFIRFEMVFGDFLEGVLAFQEIGRSVTADEQDMVAECDGRSITSCRSSFSFCLLADPFLIDCLLYTSPSPRDS